MTNTEVECLFCRILEGSLPASFVHQDERVTAFMDLYPITSGHLLIVPREHHVAIEDVASADAAAMMTLAQRIGRALMASPLGPGGFNLLLANGEAAGQDVFHAHLHLIPRYENDGFGLRHPPGHPREAQKAELDRVATTLRSAIGPM